MRKIPTKETDEGPVCWCPRDGKEVNVHNSCFTCSWKYVYNRWANYVLCDWRKGRKMSRKAVLVERGPSQEREKTVRRAPPHGLTVSRRHETTPRRLQAVEYKEYDDTIYFEAKDDGTRTVGYVRFNFSGLRGLNIDFLEVYKPFRGKGYGREIYQWLEDYAKNRGIKKITAISYEEAVGFWEKMGLKRGLWSKPGYQNMVKALDDSEAQGEKLKPSNRSE